MEQPGGKSLYQFYDLKQTRILNWTSPKISKGFLPTFGITATSHSIAMSKSSSKNSKAESFRLDR